MIAAWSDIDGDDLIVLLSKKRRRAQDNEVCRRRYGQITLITPASTCTSEPANKSGLEEKATLEFCIHTNESKTAGIEIQHVYVPEAFRGHGIAERLVKKAIALASEHDCPIIPTCSYVAQTFLPRHPDYVATTTLVEVSRNLVPAVADSKITRRRGNVRS